MPSAAAPLPSSRPGVLPSRVRAAARLDAAAFAILALVPLGMALANKSAPALLVAAAVSAAAARATEGRLGPALRQLARIARTPLGLAAAALLAWAALSLAWSALPGLSAHAFGEFAVAAGAALLLHLCLPRRVPAWAVTLAAIGTALGCATILIELASGLALRQQLGLRSALFIFKRSITAMVLLWWPLAALMLHGRMRRGRARVIALGTLLTVAVVAAHSGAALLGLIVGLALLLLAQAAPRLAPPATALLLVGSLAMAPLIGAATVRAFPPGLVDALERVQMRDRIAIWQTFGEVVARRPVAGMGFGTTPAMDRTPVAAEIPPEHRPMLAVGHPHNGFLQIEAELGLVGALGAALCFVLLARRLAAAPEGPGWRAASLGYAAAVMLVGHGAWQGWWIATLGATAVWFARIDPDDPGERTG